MNWEMIIVILKALVVAYFKVLSSHSPGETDWFLGYYNNADSIIQAWGVEWDWKIIMNAVSVIIWKEAVESNFKVGLLSQQTSWEND
jgi:hypothetical protein